MTPIELRSECLKLASEVGPTARVQVGVGAKNDEGAVYLILYARNGGEYSFLIYGNDWQALFAEARTKWTVMADEHRVRTVRKLALEIIKITAERGTCSDAALRDAEFTSAEIECYGADACADADAIAANGPFKITAIRNANAA